MIIGGIEKFSLIDYPKHLSAIVFTQGCNFRCQYCYNPMLVVPKEEDKLKNKTSGKTDGRTKRGHSGLTEDDLFGFLRARMGKLDAVVITGGEPTLHEDLPEFIKKIRKLDFKIKLDSNGTNPEMLKKLLAENLLDYIAMDIKAPMHKYDMVTAVQADLKKIKESVIIIMNSGLPYEFRTTVVPGLLDSADIESIGRFIRGAKRWYLQNFKADIALVNEDFEKAPAYSNKEMQEMRQKALEFVDFCEIR